METRPSQRPVALVAIADASARQMATDLLDQLRWSAIAAESGSHAFALLNENSTQAMLLDSWLPDLQIHGFVDECRRLYPALDIITLDEAAGPATGSRHVRRQELLYVLRQALAASTHRSQHEENHEDDATQQPAMSSSILPEEAPVDFATAAPEVAAPMPAFTPSSLLPEFVGSSPVMAELVRLIRLVAPRRTPVLIEGPTGTGKELIARAVHRLSPRAHKPMIVLNCAAIPEALLEAELFGHTRGAFTGAVAARIGRVESAHGGTLFLDEIGEMPLELQSKLLRFLESGELQRIGENTPLQVDVRVIAATNQHLARRVQQGVFRADLYYRLSVFPIASPSLASHQDDVPQLAMHFLKRHAQDGPAKQLSAEGLERLLAHSWPGNVRELEHCIERAYILADDRELILAADIEFGGLLDASQG
jgi:DNA-binding NtrC family response regulator